MFEPGQIVRTNKCFVGIPAGTIGRIAARRIPLNLPPVWEYVLIPTDTADIYRSYLFSIDERLIDMWGAYSKSCKIDGNVVGHKAINLYFYADAIELVSDDTTQEDHGGLQYL